MNNDIEPMVFTLFEGIQTVYDILQRDDLPDCEKLRDIVLALSNVEMRAFAPVAMHCEMPDLGGILIHPQLERPRERLSIHPQDTQQVLTAISRMCTVLLRAN